VSEIVQRQRGGNGACKLPSMTYADCHHRHRPVTAHKNQLIDNAANSVKSQDTTIASVGITVTGRVGVSYLTTISSSGCAIQSSDYSRQGQNRSKSTMWLYSIRCSSSYSSTICIPKYVHFSRAKTTASVSTQRLLWRVTWPLLYVSLLKFRINWLRFGLAELC